MWCSKKPKDEEEKESQVEDDRENTLELSKLERESTIQNFQFYVKNKGGKDKNVERFELAMLLSGKSF